MKKVLTSAAIVAAFVLNPLAVIAEPLSLSNPIRAIQKKNFVRVAPSATARRDLDLKIQRIWAERRQSYATVLVENTSPHELEDVVLTCTVFGKASENIDFQEQPVASSLGAGASREVRLELRPDFPRIHSMSCNARSS